jgi:hypothetical protein
MMTNIEESVQRQRLGRPRTPIDADELRRVAAQGLNLGQTAARFGLSRRRLLERLVEQPELRRAIDEGRAAGIDQISNALFEAGLRGNVAAAKFYLATRAGWVRPSGTDLDQSAKGCT